MLRSWKRRMIADADSFLAALPAGYQTLLSRRFVGGHELYRRPMAEGCDARAFYRSAPLVIIDEPTAATRCPSGV
jgi:ABC-type multidrug transport system fused ATPase/permease subunit